MSLAENLLNSLDETTYENMRIAGSGEEEHIIVGQDRSITVPNALKTIAVKGDKDVETATIDCVRYWDGNDLSTFAIYLNYILPNGDEGTYIPESITKSEDTFSFDWKIGSEFTYAQGKLTFWIVTKLTDDNGTLKKQWSSFQNSDCTIAQGGDKIYVPEKQTDQDVISQAISISRASAETAEKQAILAIEAANKAALDASQAAEEEVSRIIGELGVVQELGDSPNSVVSQLKVTKEFNKTNAKINRNSKRITNLEQGLPAEMFETDSTMAYQKDVPENVLPYASINKIGGMTYKTVNLLHYEDNSYTQNGITVTVNNDKSLTISGTSTEYVWIGLASINLTAGEQYTAKATNCPSNAQFYLYHDEDRHFFINSAYTFTAAQSDYGYVFAINPNETIDVTVYPMLNKGSTAKPYSPYFEGLRSAKVTVVKSVGENLIPLQEGHTVTQNGVTFKVNDDKSITLNGAATGDLWCALGTMYLTVGEQYTFVAKNCPKDILACYAYNDADIWAVRDTAITKIAKEERYVFVLAGGAGATFNNLTIYPMLNKGSTAKPYTPYVEHTLPIPEAVQALEGYGQGNPDDPAEYNAIIWGEYGTNQYLQKGNIVDGGWYALSTPEVTDISDLLPADNLITVEGGGTLTFENEYGYAVPSEVEYQVEV